jgi:acyl-CoA synthetase (AMP-forming)/AMP-acid ligase II
VLTVLRPEEQVEHGDSIGRAFLDCELRLADPVTGEPVEGEGELLATGPCLMAYYNGREQLTRESFDGAFFRTGDIVRRDAQGYIRLMDRKDDLIVSGGVNVFARDVEEVLSSIDGVEEVCVVGVPDERWGEAVTAAVVTSRPLDVDAMLADCRARLIPAQVPKRVLFVDELPRNAQGKVLRREIRALSSRAADPVG